MCWWCCARRRRSANHRGPRPAKDELASIGFGQPAEAGYLVRRGAAGDFLAIDAWFKPTGGCVLGKRDYRTCPRTQHIAALMHTPPGIKLRERIATVDASGAERAFDCAK